jgi:hypothetical protein
MPQICVDRLCRLCNRKLVVSDNVIINQINAKSYLDNICIGCCEIPNPYEFNLELNMFCFEEIYKRKSVDFMSATDRQLILTELYHGLNRDLLCYFGKLFQKIEKGIFVLRNYKNDLEEYKISIKWFSLENNNRENYAFEKINKSTITFEIKSIIAKEITNIKKNDIYILLEQNDFIFPYLLSNFLVFDNIDHRRRTYDKNNLNQNIIDEIDSYENNYSFNCLISLKIAHCRKNTEEHNEFDSINREECKKLFAMYSLRCDECGIKIDLSYYQSCKRAYSINRISKFDGFNFNNCRLTCTNCAKSCSIKINQEYKKYLPCNNCLH